MTVTLELKPEIESRLMERARSKGKNLDRYLTDVIENDARNVRTLDEILAPFRDEFEAKGMSDTEFEDLVEVIRNDIHVKQQ